MSGEKSFHDALADTVSLIEGALARIEQQDDAQAVLHNLRADLTKVLELVERNPGIEAAADDLRDAAESYVAAQDHRTADGGRLGLNPARGRALADAFARFRDRLLQARPNERARLMGSS